MKDEVGDVIDPGLPDMRRGPGRSGIGVWCGREDVEWVQAVGDHQLPIKDMEIPVIPAVFFLMEEPK